MSCAACGEAHPPGAERCPRTGDPVGVGPCGTQIDRYAVERLIGGGGMGAVYRAKHAVLGHSVALKLLRAKGGDGAEMARRFQREAQIAAAVGNPHIVRVSDFGETASGQPFLVMELLAGADLESVIARRGPLPVEQAVDIARQLLDGLGAAHQAGVIHRDLKPANVFLTHPPDAPDAPRDFVKILDFGISKVTTDTGHSLTKTGMVLGTPTYMAPEQARGLREQDQRVDLYAVAVILYQMLARALPFVGSSYEELVIRICTEPPQPLAKLAPHVAPALVAVVERGMAREPFDRWPTAAAFATALREASRGAGERRQVMGDGLPPAPAAAAPVQEARGRAEGPAAASLPVAAAPAQEASGRVKGPAAMPVPVPAPARRGGQARGDGSSSPRLLAAALGLLAVAILVAAGAAIWIASRSSQPQPQPVLVATPSPSPAAPVPAAPILPAVPITPVPPAAPDPGDVADIFDDLDFSDIPTPEQIARLTAQAQAYVSVPPAPPPSQGASIGEPFVVGDLPAGGLSRRFARALPALQRCRLPGHAGRLRVQLMVGGGTTMAVAMPPPAGVDPSQHACATNALRDAAQSLDDSEDSGIVYVEVALAPR